MAVTYSAFISKNGALLDFRLKVFVQNSKLHGVIVYTKSVKESTEISCISLQSSKRSFRKIQIFKFAYSALPPYKTILHRVVYTKTVKESEEISCISLQSSRSSFRKIQIFKFAYSVLPLFYSLFRLKSSLHRVVYTKRVKELEEISCISLQSSKPALVSQNTDFKICIFCTSAVFIPWLGYRTEESDCCDTGCVHFST